MTIDITSLSSKGQVVIPNRIRKEMGIAEGAKLMIVTDGDNILLKPIQPPRREEFASLLKKSRQLAKKHGLKKSDVDEAIKQVRSESRR